MSFGFTSSAEDGRRRAQQRAVNRIAELKRIHGFCKTCGNAKIAANTQWFEGRAYCRICVESGAINLSTGRWVYFIADGLGHVKIGFAVNVPARLRELQCGNVQQLRVLAAIRGGCDVERELHQRFSVHRVRGEWFRLVPEIEALIESVRAEAGS